MRTKSAVLAVSVLALAALAAPLAQADDKTASEKGPKISVEPASFDFGKALPGKTLEKQFSIRNFGDADLVIEQITTTCGCTAGLMEDQHKTLKPGQSGQLRVRLETRDYSGRVVRSVMVRSNDPEKKLFEVKVEATVQPAPAKQ
jgi:hypothetical protein